MTPTKIQIGILDKALLYGGTPTYNATLAEVCLLKYPDLNDVEAIAVALFYRRTMVARDYDAPHFVANMKPETIANWKSRIASWRETTIGSSTFAPPTPVDNDAMFTAWTNIRDAYQMASLAQDNLKRCSFAVYRTFPRG